MTVQNEVEKIEARMTLGLSLYQLRKSKGLSGYALAQNGAISEAQVRTIESGKRGYHIDTLVAYFEALEIDFSEVVDSLSTANSEPEKKPVGRPGRPYLPELQWTAEPGKWTVQEVLEGIRFTYNVYIDNPRFEVISKHGMRAESGSIDDSFEGDDLLREAERMLNRQWREEKHCGKYRIDPNF